MVRECWASVLLVIEGQNAKFCFLRMPELRNFASWYFASGTEGREVYDI